MVRHGQVRSSMETIMGKEEWMYGRTHYGVERKKEATSNDCREGRRKVEEVREAGEDIKDQEEEEKE